MTAPVNGTDERLDAVIALLSELVIELRLAREGRASVDVTNHSTGTLAPVPAKNTRKGR